MNAKRRPPIASLLMALFCVPSFIHAAVLHVGENAVYKTVNAAVAAAHPGDTIQVHAGVYREQIIVDKALLLKALPGAVIDSMGKGTVIVITKGPSEIRGFTVRGSGASQIDEDAGIRLIQANNSIVAENRIDDVLFGVSIISSSHVRIVGNQIVGKDLIAPRRGDGIRVHDSSHTFIERNRIERSRDLAIWQSNDVVVRRNEVRASRYGLHFMYCDDSLFEDNVFEDNQVGAAIMYSRRLTLRRNQFTGSRGVGGVGFFIKVGDDVIAENNRIVDNARGIFLEQAPQARRAQCIIRNNLIAGNDVGISMQPAVERAVFTENAFVANRVQVEVMGGVMKPKDFSTASKGNYWSDYIGFDKDGDGVGDTPYQIEQFFETLANRWPETGLLRMGPASEALEMAARAFPLGRPRVAAIDRRPLLEPPLIDGPTSGLRANAGLWFPGAMLIAGCCVTLNRAWRRFSGATER